MVGVVSCDNTATSAKAELGKNIKQIVTTLATWKFSVRGKGTNRATALTRADTGVYIQYSIKGEIEERFLRST